MFAYCVRAASLMLAVLGTGCAAFPFVATRARLDDGPRFDPAIRETARIGRVCLLLLAAVALPRLYLQLNALRFADEPLLRSFGPLMTATLWGKGWMLQVGGALAAAFAFSRTAESKTARIVVADLMIVVALSFALSGHAAAAESRRTLLIATDLVHMVVAGMWVGTLAMIAWNMNAFKGNELARMVNAFSPLAMVAVAILAATGAIAALTHVPSWSALANTRYGQTLVAKLVFVGATLVGGFTNWRRNRLRITADGGIALRRGAVFELGVAALAILATALLINTAPPGE